jgi:hypothetical protein
MAEKTWSYGNFRIVEGLKPESGHFQYFFTVFERGNKKCRYCIWIDDENLDRYGRAEGFEEIASLKREEWSEWVRGKIDDGNFADLVLKLEKEGQKEIDLGDMNEKLKPQ